MTQEWLSTRDVADRVGYSVRWVEKQIELGRLRAVAFTGGDKRTFRIRTSELDRFCRTYFRDALLAEPASWRSPNRGV